METHSGSTPDSAQQEGDFSRLNTEFWAGGNFVKTYAHQKLRPPEAAILERRRDTLAGRVLEIGCGAGRLTGHLIELSASVHGVDVSPAMVAYCRGAYPQATFAEGDLRDLSSFQSTSYEVVVAPFNVIDVLGHSERERMFDELARMLSPHGLLIFSTHNRGFASSVHGPLRLSLSSPRALIAGIVRLPRRLGNHRRLAPFERSESDYMIVNDSAHDFSVLHYYVCRDDQQRQLAEHGFELLECVDLEGRLVEPGAQAADCSELHYVARLSDSAGGVSAEPFTPADPTPR